MEGRFRALDGITLYEQWWHPSTEPKAIVGIIHGLCEHSGRYRETADYLIEHGFAVDTFDLRGHGRSGGETLQIDSFDEYLNDLDVFLGRVRDRNPKKPLFLMGHSMGAGILLLYALSRPTDIRGLIVNAPFIKVSQGLSPIRQKLVAIAGRVMPRMPLIRLNPGYFSQNPDVLLQREHDELIYHGKIPAKILYELLQSARKISDLMEHITCPMLILHGSEDRLAAVEGSEILHSRIKSTEKILKIYSGLRHDLLHEPEKEKIWQDIAEWMGAHVRPIR